MPQTNQACSPPLLAALAGTDLTPGLEEILTSNSTSHHPQVRSEALLATPLGMLGRAGLTVLYWGVRMTAGKMERQLEDL